MKLLVLSGAMGAGKTTVMAEASDLLKARGVVHAAAGVDRLLLAAAVEDRAMLDRIRQALPSSEIFVCRLRASLATLQRRVRLREPGMLQSQLVARAAELDARLDRAALEDFGLDNEDGSVTQLAEEMLRCAGRS